METLNFIVRRIVAWPVLGIGVTLVEVGGWLIRTAAWCIDIPQSELPPRA